MNRFNQIFTQQEYVPLVQPLPYEAIAGMGADIEKRAEEDLMKSFQLKELFNKTKVAKVDLPFWKKKDEEYQPLLANITDKATKGDPTARKDMYELLAKYNADQDFRMFEHNYAVEQEAEKSAIKLREDGNWSDVWSDNFRSNAASRGDQFGLVNWQGHDPRLDYEKRSRDIMSGIADQILIQAGDITPTNRGTYFRNLQVSGVNQRMIRDVAIQSVDAFLTAPEGKSFVNDLLHSGASPDDIPALAVDYLEKSAWKQLSIKGGGTAQGFLPKHWMEDQQTVPELGMGQGKKIGKGKNKRFYDQFSEFVSPVKTAADTRQGIEYESQEVKDRRSFKPTAPKYSPRNISEQITLETANRALGLHATSGKEALQNLKDYYSAYNNGIDYDIYSHNTNPKLIKEKNFALFDKGSLQITTTDGIAPIDDPTNIMHGSDFYTKYQAQIEKGQVGVSKTLQLINHTGIPYAPVITIGKEEFIIRNPLATNVKAMDYKIAEWGQAAFSAEPIEVKIPVEDTNGNVTNKKYYLQFERETNPELSNTGEMTFSSNGVARLYREDGTVVASTDDEGSMHYSQAIELLYYKVLPQE